MKWIITVLFLASSFVVHGQKSPFLGDLKIGEYDVGFKTIQLYDSTRKYGKHYRPLLISVWYPAKVKTESVLYFEDYLLHDAIKLNPNLKETTNQEQASKTFVSRAKLRGAQETELLELIETKTSAYLNAEPLAGDFPVITTVQGGGRPAYTNFILNEYLASHGYIVASIGDIREGPNRRQTTALGNARALSKDISLIEPALLNEGFRLGASGVIAFSRAGEAVILNQKENTSFTAAVFLDAQPDSTLISELGRTELSKVQLPLLAFFSNHQKKMTYSEAIQDTSAFEFLRKSEATKIRMMESNHGNLTSAAMIGEYMVKKYDRWPLIGNAKLGYETICLLILEFFGEKIKEHESTMLKNPIDQLKLKSEFLVIHRAGK